MAELCALTLSLSLPPSPPHRSGSHRQTLSTAARRDDELAWPTMAAGPLLQEPEECKAEVHRALAGDIRERDAPEPDAGSGKVGQCTASPSTAPPNTGALEALHH